MMMWDGREVGQDGRRSREKIEVLKRFGLEGVSSCGGAGCAPAAVLAAGLSPWRRAPPKRFQEDPTVTCMYIQRPRYLLTTD
jgi:hypothetical protein